jgi:acyl-coenzyme A thioesterase PaaI-like protein
VIHAESRLLHGGRTTQIWDATVSDDNGKTLALFRCTQLLVY